MPSRSSVVRNIKKFRKIIFISNPKLKILILSCKQFNSIFLNTLEEFDIGSKANTFALLIIAAYKL